MQGDPEVIRRSASRSSSTSTEAGARAAVARNDSLTTMLVCL